jgi:ectoine hydroxylase-related dioxygenase (phytanoyl-CoA dioxygenase family)
VQTIWFLSELDHENGGTRILPSSALWKRVPRRPRGHTLVQLGEEELAAQSAMDEERFAKESIPATGAPGDMLVYIGQSWHTAGVNITDERTRVALVGQWIPMWAHTHPHPHTPTHPHTHTHTHTPPQYRRCVCDRDEADGLSECLRRRHRRHCVQVLSWGHGAA